MQHVQHGLHPDPSTIKLLPMIDMDPSDLTCFYPTLKFVCAQAKRLGVTPILTFDQPLWWKAILIVSMEPQSSNSREIVLRPGGLHMEMSFLDGRFLERTTGGNLRKLCRRQYATWQGYITCCPWPYACECSAKRHAHCDDIRLSTARHKRT